MKIGVNIKIDVNKIDKDRLFKGQKGTYLDLTTFIDTDNAGQYGDHGMISQATTKEEREQGVKTPILGNCKVFYKGESENQGHSQAPPQSQTPDTAGFNDDFDAGGSTIPF